MAVDTIYFSSLYRLFSVNKTEAAFCPVQAILFRTSFRNVIAKIVHVQSNSIKRPYHTGETDTHETLFAYTVYVE